MANSKPDLEMQMNPFYNVKSEICKVRNSMFTIANCLHTMPDMTEKSINTIVTSPPYNLNKSYGEYRDNVDFKEWTDLIDNLAKQSYRILTDNGSFFLNVSPIPDKKTKEIIPLESYAYFIFKEHGFHLRNSIIWHFNNMQNCTNRLSGRWESILWFVKDLNSYKFNLDDIRVPFISKKDKRLDGKTGRNPTDVWKYEVDDAESDFWYFDVVNNMTKKKLGISEHPCVYPKQMIERIIRMTTDKGDIVFDPFLGSGTTLVAAENLQRIGLGCELGSNFKQMIINRVTNEVI